MIPRSIVAGLMLTACLAPATAPAARENPTGALVLSSADRALVDRAAAYLRALKTAEAGFTQVDPHGGESAGTFSLQRPGKARFAYDPPTDLTVVADGANVDVYDGKLKTFDQYPLKQTPLAMLLGADVRFDRTVVVTAVSHQDGGFTITARDARRQAEGRLALSFTDAPISLAGWTVIDAQGGKTVVRLAGLRSGLALPPRLFVLRDPRPSLIKP